MRIQLSHHTSGFTLMELMMGITIFGMIMILILSSVHSISVARTKSINRIALLEELYFFSEQLAVEIKEGGTIDYEEYWNRRMVNMSGGTIATQSGHYRYPTGVGNYGNGGNLSTTYGSGPYYCLSASGASYLPGDTKRMRNDGCYDNTRNNIGMSMSGKYQRYGEYVLQYWDHNSDGNGDGGTPGDVNGDGNIVGDEDDKYIGDGPDALSGASMPELYLYDPIKKERIFFRYTWETDPNKDTSTGVCTDGTQSGCLGNIEILRLSGHDVGYTHSGVATHTGTFDGKIDTWVCAGAFSCEGPAIALLGGKKLATGKDKEWTPLFPNYVNVKNLDFSVFPTKDPWLAWGSTDIKTFTQPYVRVRMTLGLSWERRKLIRNDDPTITVNTSISLASPDILYR